MHIKADNKNREGEEERLRFGSQHPAGIPRREMEGGAEASSLVILGRRKKPGKNHRFEHKQEEVLLLRKAPEGEQGEKENRST